MTLDRRRRRDRSSADRAYSAGARPVDGRRTRTELEASDSPLWNSQVTFSEYFHGDTGEGLGASLPDRLDGADRPRPLPPVSEIDDPLLARARRLVVPGQRRLLGITGAPAAGKSNRGIRIGSGAVPRRDSRTDGWLPLGAARARAVGDEQERKGAPDTFDGAGFLALMRRSRRGDRTRRLRAGVSSGD